MKVVVLGAGQVGESLAKRLVGEDSDVTLVDSNRQCLDRVTENLDVGHLCGNAASPAVLKEAGIDTADLLVAVTDEDEVNLLACLVGGSLAPGCTLVARVRDEDFHEYRELLEQGGVRVDGWISPRRAAAQELADLVLLPGAREVKPFLGGELRMVSSCIRPNSSFVGASLASLRGSGVLADLTVVGIERGGYFVPPKGKTELRAGDLLYVVGRPIHADKLPHLCGHPPRRLRTVMILGGGRVGSVLARRLLEAGLNVKIADGDINVCHQVAEALPRADVLNGDCTDQDFLIEERISHVDTFVACSRDDEVNVLTALLAKKLGAGSVLVRENTAHYSSLMDSVGVDASVSVRRAAVGSILRYARRGDVVMAQPFGQTEGEALEVRAHQTSTLASAPIGQLNLPKDVVIGAIRRGSHVTVADGDLQIQEGDSVVIFAPQRRLAAVQKLVAVGLDFF